MGRPKKVSSATGTTDKKEVVKKQSPAKRNGAIAEALKEINDIYGDNVFFISEESIPSAEVIDTGSIALNLMLNGGYRKGSIIHIWGPEQSGKSTLCLHFLANFNNSLYVDTEQSFDAEYAKTIGVVIGDNCTLCQPEWAEQAFTIINKLATKVEAIVFDSVTETPIKKELEGEMEDKTMGDKAKLLSKALRIIKATKHRATMFFVDQVRQNPGMTYGSPDVVPGGNALKFGAHLRLKVVKTEPIKDGEDVIGHYMHVKAVKNKTGGIPFATCKIPIIYNGKGISRSQEILDIGVEKGIIVKAGSWFSYDGSRLAQGSNNTRTLLEDNPELMEKILVKIKAPAK